MTKRKKRPKQLSPDLPPAVRLIVQAGMIPKDMLLQLESWKLLPEGATEEAGSQQISLEFGWQTAQEFVDRLEGLIEDEASSIRETEFITEEGFQEIYLSSYKPRYKYVELAEVMFDKMGRMFVGGKWVKEGVCWASFDGSTVYKVEKTEERFVGDTVTTLVCYLRRVDDAADYQN